MYNPDWAIAFQEGEVRHICFAAETKGSMSSPGLRRIKKTNVECARRFFAGVINKTMDGRGMKYDVVDSCDKLMALVN